MRCKSPETFGRYRYCLWVLQTLAMTCIVILYLFISEADSVIQYEYVV